MLVPIEDSMEGGVWPFKNFDGTVLVLDVVIRDAERELRGYGGKCGLVWRGLNRDFVLSKEFDWRCQS